MPTVQAEVEINAPADVVWSVLTDFDNYSEWHPSIQGIALYGPLTENTKGSLSVISKPGASPSQVGMILTEVEPGKAMSWKGGLGPTWLALGFHYHYLQPLPSGATRLVHGEAFSGLLFKLLWPLFKGKFDREYAEASSVLKRRCEAMN